MPAGEPKEAAKTSGHIVILTERDRQQLIDLIVEFAWRVDHRSADGIHELVTEDVLIQMAYGPIEGKEAVKAWGRERAAVDRTTRHLMSNFRFHMVEPDKVEASSMSLIFRNDAPEISQALPWGLVECNDIFVRQDGTWKFASHITTDIFFTG